MADLAEASATFSRLGFSVSPGGEHVGLGTHNALIRFGLDYLELLALRDEAEASGGGGSTAPIVERLRDGKTGLANFALATTAIDQDAVRLRQNGLPAEGPFAMQRRRPDGKLLTWRLLVPGGSSWGRPWPFLIQWDQDDPARLASERPTTHPNGARRIAGVSVAVTDLDAATDLYERQLGLVRGNDSVVPRITSRCRGFRVGIFEIGIHVPMGPGWLADRLESAGEGIFEVALAVERLDETLAVLGRAGIDTERDGSTVVVPGTAMGARFVLIGDAA